MNDETRDYLVRLDRYHKRRVGIFKATEDVRALYWAKHFHLNTRSQAMTFGKGSHYLYSLYKQIGDIPHLVVEKSVQCGLSELFIIQSHIDAGEMGMTVMYILPKYELRNRFVNNRIYKIHKRIPHYATLVLKAETKVHRTSLMHFGNGTLAYVGSNVQDEFIEIPVDSAYIDEKDRCNLSNLLMLPDRLTASPYAYQREISNPTIEGFGIDERYAQSSQGEYKLKCPGCGEWFTPDFFKHVVEPTGVNTYKPRDPNADPDPLSGQEIDLIHTCGSPVNRLLPGEWVHAYPDRKWKGFRVSKIFAQLQPTATLRDLYFKWSYAAGNDLKTQIFMNSDLGLPYTGAGSKVTTQMLDACRRNYAWPVERVQQDRARFMGVDVGEHLHCVLRERVNIPGEGWTMRLIGLWVLVDFNELVRKLREWKPKCCVIDSMPEIHKVMDLKTDFDNVWSSRFQAGAGSLTKHKHTRELRMDRTAIMDYVKQGFEEQRLTLPMHASSFEGGEYYAQVEAPTRLLEANEIDPEKSKFVWREGSKPDHFFLAEAYCIQASMAMPEHGIFEFFDNAAQSLDEYSDRTEVPVPGMTPEKREEIARVSHLTPQVVMNNILQASQKAKPAPTKRIDPVMILDTIDLQYSTQGYADLPLVVTMTKTNEEAVRKVLAENGYVESRLKGQFIKE